MMTVLAIALLAAYAAVNLLACFGAAEHKPDRATRRLYLVSALITAGACLLLVGKSPVCGLLTCLIGLAGFAACAVHNGIRMHGRLHWKHHIIRGAASAVLVALYAIAAF